jgi:hypothetical protein
MITVLRLSCILCKEISNIYIEIIAIYIKIYSSSTSFIIGGDLVKMIMLSTFSATVSSREGP